MTHEILDGSQRFLMVFSGGPCQKQKTTGSAVSHVNRQRLLALRAGVLALKSSCLAGSRTETGVCVKDDLRLCCAPWS